MSRKCQKCSEFFDNKLGECPSCGAPYVARYTSKYEQPAEPYDHCNFVVEGRPCRFPATIYLGSTNAPFEGKGVCRLHFDCRNPQAMADIVTESERWLKDVRAGRDVQSTYMRHDGRTVPGYPTIAQLKRLPYEPGAV